VRIGVLTGGGDCPGLNAVIRAVVRKGIDGYGHAIVGFRDGWRGPLENAYEELTIESTRGILPRGGTILRSSRTNPFKRDDGPGLIAENLRTLTSRASSRSGARTPSGPPPGCTRITGFPFSAFRRRSTTTSAEPT